MSAFVRTFVSAALLVGLHFANAAAAAPPPPVVFVNAALTTGNNDGSSWADAFRGRFGLQAAIGSLAPGAGAELWVAQGVYAPGPTQSMPVNSRMLTFNIPSGASLLGGFAGNETLASQRDPASRTTILTGDLSGDGNDNGISTENSAHVVTIREASPTTVVDGFTITGGHAATYGLGNSVDREQGAGILIIGGAPRLRNCRFAENLADWFGGGACIDGATDAVLESCRFEANTCRYYGPGAAVVNAAAARFSGCTFEQNIGGSGIGIFSGRALQFNTGTCTTLVEDCTFRSNHGDIGANSGGGILDMGGRITIRRCFFDRNDANGGGGVFFANGTIANVDACRFFGNLANGDLGDALYLAQGGSGVFTNCAIWGHIRGPGVFSDASPVFANSGQMELINCTIANNGSTLTSPSAITATGSGSISLKNSIVWGNFGAGLSPAGAAARAFGGSTLRFDRCIVQGGTGAFPGANNSGADPRLVSINGADGTRGTLDDDLHPAAGSPCIDAGDGSFLNVAVVADLDGAVRRRNDPATPDTGPGAAPVIDIGAFEFTPPRPPCQADFTGDGEATLEDLFEFLALYFSNCTGQPASPCNGRSADINGQSGVSVQDVFDFLALYFSGCP